MKCINPTNLFTIAREGQVHLYRNNHYSEVFTIMIVGFDCMYVQAAEKLKVQSVAGTILHDGAMGLASRTLLYQE